MLRHRYIYILYLPDISKKARLEGGSALRVYVSCFVASSVGVNVTMLSPTALLSRTCTDLSRLVMSGEAFGSVTLVRFLVRGWATITE